MKTLLFYINSISHGGAERAILETAHSFALGGYRAILVTSFVSEDEYPVPDNVERLSIEREEIKQSSVKKNIRRIRALRKLIKQYKPGAVIAFMTEPGARAVAACAGLPAKCVISVRSDPNRLSKSKMLRFTGRHILTKADGCVFQTQDARDWFPEKFRKRSEVIMNPVDRRFFETKRREPRDIVTVGRLDPLKNHKMLIEAFAAVSEKHKETRLRIYGKGKLEGEIAALIKDKHLEDRVILEGLSDDIPNVLSGAEIFVLSSDSEGMPNALAEALAVGVPCISTDCPCGGPKTLIKNGENGLLVPVGDTKAMAEAMDKLLSDKRLAGELGKTAAERAKEFHTDAVFAHWKKYIEEVIGQRRDIM